MSERQLRRALEDVELPAEAEERGWRVVEAAFAEREPAPRKFPARPVLALALVGVLAAAVASPPGRAVLGSVREAIGVERAQPSLFALPAKGRLLVTSPAGAWVVADDGGKRLLGPYEDASWSPFGRFVIAARTDELAALEPDGTVRWKLSRRAVRYPCWAGTRTDTRIVYLSGGALRAVAGDGTDDRRLTAGVAPVAPACRRGGGFVVAVARGGEVVALSAETRQRLWARPVRDVRALEWSRDGKLLLVRGARSLVVLDDRGRLRFDLLRPDLAAPVAAAAFAPTGRAIAFVQRAGGRSQLWLIPALRPDGSAARRVFAGPGAFSGLAWSPDGRWLLLAWQDADQWLFFRPGGNRAVDAVSDISGQFGGGGFPMLGGWANGP